MRLSSNEIDKESEKLIDLITDYLLEKYQNKSKKSFKGYLEIVNPIFDNLNNKLEERKIFYHGFLKEEIK